MLTSFLHAFLNSKLCLVTGKFLSYQTIRILGLGFYPVIEYTNIGLFGSNHVIGIRIRASNILGIRIQNYYVQSLNNSLYSKPEKGIKCGYRKLVIDKRSCENSQRRLCVITLHCYAQSTIDYQALKFFTKNKIKIHLYRCTTKYRLYYSASPV